MKPGEWIGSDNESPESQRFVGMSRTKTLELADDEKIVDVRVIEAKVVSYLTADWRRDRLNLVMDEHGVVSKAAFF
jgi:hypothetical protein